MATSADFCRETELAEEVQKFQSHRDHESKQSFLRTVLRQQSIMKSVFKGVLLSSLSSLLKKQWRA